MKTNAEIIIELIKVDGTIRQLYPYRIHLLKNSLSINKKFGIETIAIFKVYPKYETKQN